MRNEIKPPPNIQYSEIIWWLNWNYQMFFKFQWLHIFRQPFVLGATSAQHICAFFHTPHPTALLTFAPSQRTRLMTNDSVVISCSCIWKSLSVCMYVNIIHFCVWTQCTKNMQMCMQDSKKQSKYSTPFPKGFLYEIFKISVKGTGEMKKDKVNKSQTCTLYYWFLVIFWDAGSEAYSPVAQTLSYVSALYRIKPIS